MVGGFLEMKKFPNSYLNHRIALNVCKWQIFKLSLLDRQCRDKKSALKNEDTWQSQKNEKILFGRIAFCVKVCNFV